MTRYPAVRKAVIPVAGLASRLYPASRAVRKEFFPASHEFRFLQFFHRQAQ